MLMESGGSSLVSSLIRDDEKMEKDPTRSNWSWQCRASFSVELTFLYPAALVSTIAETVYSSHGKVTVNGYRWKIRREHNNSIEGGPQLRQLQQLRHIKDLTLIRFEEYIPRLPLTTYIHQILSIHSLYLETDVVYRFVTSSDISNI